MKHLCLLIAILMLAGCMTRNPAPKTTTSVKEDFRDGTKGFRATVADFLYPEVDHKNRVDPVAEVQIKPYCYKTWEKPVCYEQPLPGEEERVVGSDR